MNEDAKNFAFNLARLMDHHKDTQTTLAAKSGVSQKTVSNMLNPGEDKAPNLDNVGLVAKRYGLQTWHMLIPNAPIDILINSSIEKLVENYVAIDKDGRETVARVAENSARYISADQKQIKKA